MTLETLELLQLADACFPSGGFAFSSGLESLAKLGYVKRMEDFLQYLDCHLDQITSAELPFLNSAYAESGPSSFPSGPAAAAGPAPEGGMQEGGSPGPGFREVVLEWDAWLFLPAQRRASLSQGRAWARAMEETFDAPGPGAVRPWFLREKLPLHFLMVFAATLRSGGVSLADAQSLLLHMAMRDQLGAAVRLGLLGSLQAQKLHRRFIAVGEGYRAARKDWSYLSAMRAAPMIDMAVASHPHLYSKLFQS
ncbi:MAG TPA: urease accessory UreF family protein [Fibrobacteria bacterium]|nr:urease accessory UreF family protein [Fibrobacteria bacterium]